MKTNPRAEPQHSVISTRKRRKGTRSPRQAFRKTAHTRLVRQL